MSWSVYQVIPNDAQSAAGVREVIQAMNVAYEVSPESLEQLAVAKEAAIAIVESGVVKGWPFVYVSLSGHANPEHKFQPGWSEDSVSVTVGGRSVKL